MQQHEHHVEEPPLHWRAFFPDTVVPDAIPAIVPKDLFDRVQKRLEKNKRAPAHGKADEEYLLTTKLFCGKCGA